MSPGLRPVPGVDTIEKLSAVLALDKDPVPKIAFALLVSKIDTVPVGATELLRIPVTVAVRV
jgi:hypothetical protein